jgi:hypothetical protein
MKTIILIGIALTLGCAVMAQGTGSAQGSTDWYSFNPYTMSMKPPVPNGNLITPVPPVKTPVIINYGDNTPPNPVSWRKYPLNNDPKLDLPGHPKATHIIVYMDPQ